MGFILLAFGWGGQPGLVAAMVNVINHALIKASLFLSAGYVTERLGEQSIPRLGGLARLTTGSAIAFGLGAAALAGLPPLSGFLSKLTFFQAALATRDTLWLTVAALAGALSIAYSLRAFVAVYWGPTPKWAIERWVERDSRQSSLLAPLLLALLFVGLGAWPGPLIALATATAAQLGQPSIYVAAVLGGAR